MNINKQALLEWLKKEASSGDSDIWNKNFNYGLEYVMENIQSGRFDVPCTQEEPCPECLKESVNGYKIIESELTGEIQRLRAALERIVTVYEECDCTAKDLYLIAVNEVGSKQPKVANEVHEAAPKGDGNDA